jgi:hypothetical protein
MGAPESAHSLTYSTAEQRAQRRNGPFCAIRENTLATALAFVNVRAYIALSFNNRHSNDVLPVPGRPACCERRRHDRQSHRYLLKLFAASPAGQDPRRRTLIAHVLDDFAHLSAQAAEETSPN